MACQQNTTKHSINITIFATRLGHIPGECQWLATSDLKVRE